MTSKKEVAVVKNTQLGSLSEDALAIMAKDSGEFVDEVAVEDVAIPRIVILQSGSGQVKKADPKCIKGAEEGDLYNTMTNEIIKSDEGFLFIPAKRRKVYIEWKDRKEGGGIVNHFGGDSTEYDNATKNEKGKHKSERGNDIIETHDVFGLIINSKTNVASEIMMSFSNSQVKKMKHWNALMRSLSLNGKQLPIYAGTYRLKTIPESRNEWSWFNYDIKFEKYTLELENVGPELYNRAKALREIVSSESVKVNYETETEKEDGKI